MKNLNSNELKKELKYIKIAAVFIVISILSIYLIKFGKYGLSNEQSVWANFGDYFGGVLNPIFAFMALIALLRTIQLQSYAIEQSNSELELTRKELEKSAEAQSEQSYSLELQNKATRQQTLENTFFQLNDLVLKTTNNIHMELIVKSKGLKINGHEEMFSYALAEALPLGKHTFTGKLALSKFIALLKVHKNLDYDNFNSKYEDYTGIYFGQIYQIIKFIDESEIDNKQRYVNIFRAQFTKDELEFLFYHCLGSIGKRKFKGLIESYEFFEHITYIEKKDEISKSLSAYEISAYGKNETLRKMHKDYKKPEKDKYWNVNLEE